MKNLYVSAFCLILAANSAHALEPLEPEDDLSSDTLNVMSAEEIEDRIMQRSMIEQTQELRDGTAPITMPIRKPGKESAPTDSSVADLIARIGFLEEETRGLNGKISELEFQLKNITEQLEAQKATTSKLAADAQKYVSRPGDVNDKYVIKLDNAEADESATDSTEESFDDVVTDPAQKEENDFDAAIVEVSNQNLKAAKEKFTAFIAAYPESEKLAEAYFWLGEISMDESLYKDGALNYLKSYKADKKGKRAEEALLKSSTALGKLGKKDEACKNLTVLKNMEALQPLIKEQASSEAIKLGCK